MKIKIMRVFTDGGKKKESQGKAVYTSKERKGNFFVFHQRLREDLQRREQRPTWLREYSGRLKSRLSLVGEH